MTPPATFYHFPCLPLELQDHVWTIAAASCPAAAVEARLVHQVLNAEEGASSSSTVLLRRRFRKHLEAISLQSLEEATLQQEEEEEKPQQRPGITPLTSLRQACRLSRAVADRERHVAFPVQLDRPTTAAFASGDDRGVAEAALSHRRSSGKSINNITCGRRRRVILDAETDLVVLQPGWTEASKGLSRNVSIMRNQATSPLVWRVRVRCVAVPWSDLADWRRTQYISALLGVIFALGDARLLALYVLVNPEQLQPLSSLSLVSPTAASIVEEGKGEIAGEAPTTEATSKSTPLPDTRARQAYINACEEIELGDTEFYGNSRQYFEVPECQLHRPIDDFITKICQAILELRTTRRWRYLQMHQDEEVYKDSLAIRIMTYRDVI